jgi:hypothetical protein
MERILNTTSDGVEARFESSRTRLESELGDLFDRPDAVRQSLDSYMEEHGFSHAVTAIAFEPERIGTLNIARREEPHQHGIYDVRTCDSLRACSAAEGLKLYERDSLGHTLAEYHLMRAQKLILAPEQPEEEHEDMQYPDETDEFEPSWMTMEQWEAYEAREAAKNPDPPAWASSAVENLRVTWDVTRDELAELPTNYQVERHLESAMRDFEARQSEHSALLQELQRLRERVEALETIARKIGRFLRAHEDAHKGFCGLYNQPRAASGAFDAAVAPDSSSCSHYEVPPRERALRTLQERPEQFGELRSTPQLRAEELGHRMSRYWELVSDLHHNTVPLPDHHLKPLASKGELIRCTQQLRNEGVMKRLNGVNQSVWNSRHCSDLTRGINRTRGISRF